MFYRPAVNQHELAIGRVCVPATAEDVTDDLVEKAYRGLYGDGPMDDDLLEHARNTLTAALEGKQT